MVALEDNGWEGWRPEALRALSRGTEAVSVFHNSSEGYFSYAADGALLVQFELLFPWRRWGGRPDLLVEQMRAVGLDPDRREPPPVELAAAGQAVRLARLDHDPVVAEALAAAQAGQGREVDDRSALGRRIRGWSVEVRIAELVGSDPLAPLDAQLRTANLLRAAGRADELPPLRDPSPWLGEARRSLLVRWRAGQAVRAALLADPRTGLSATLEALRHLPGDPWPELRAAALAVLRPGGAGSGSW